MRGRLLTLILTGAVAAAASADVVQTNDRARYEGRILHENETEVVLLTYDRGQVSIPKSEIARITRGKSKFDTYDKQLEKRAPETADDHCDLGDWCKKIGLSKLAEEHWTKAIGLDPDHEKARKALGHVKEGDRWLTEDEYYAAQGWTKIDGKWVSQDELRKQREAKLAGQIKEAVKMDITFRPDAPEEQLESWRDKVKFWSKIIWDLTGGAVYLAEVNISDQSESGHCVVVNLDQMNIDARGNSGLAEPGRHKFKVGGLCNAFVFVHEFMHAWAAVPDHYGTTIPCLMNSSERSRIFKWKFCDPCWGKVRGTWSLPFRPEWIEGEELPGVGAPGEHGRPKDYGDPPETRIAVTDR